MGLRSASAKRRFTQSVIALVAVMTAGAASAVSVTLPTNATIAAVPQTTVVPVSIGDTTGILGIAVSFMYASNIATATLVQGTALTASCTIVPSIGTPGMVIITAACPSGLPSGQSGAIFNVTFQGVSNGFSKLMFTPTNEVPDGCLLNEGTPSCETNLDGGLTVGPVVATATATATSTNTAIAATATASATRTATATATNTVPTATATATATITFTNTAGPSPTASTTRTTTSTATPTLTGTTTNTPVSTNTPTTTFTASQTPTETETRAATATRTITNTPNATTTRPPIPVVPSPASPAGVLMIIGLGGGLLWALRRVSKD